ncbi:hypothetical protein EJ08DRAFT_212560 [Tothia fuscella]|uniref:LysM domain-containing protein n=1 Tax=Tothia fuscella TaxID=1048955 RepID=A0A9P4NRL0_9PEZI|nr:hypothetical protein EJ08DRAFT_212560 [Tothia fuscella]
MSRFAQYDEDSRRLPEGMTRVGYDADTERYSFQDRDGNYWEGPPGSRYGTLRPVGHHPQENDETDPFLGSPPPSEQHLDHYQKESWRMMMPFFLLCAVFLLVVFWWVGRSSDDGTPTPAPVVCSEHSITYAIKKGDTCWDIARACGSTVQDLNRKNSGLDCAKLHIGSSICIPKTA